MGVLGQGSMGEVRAAAPASDPSQTVVIKILRPDIADTPAPVSSSSGKTATPPGYNIRTSSACSTPESIRNSGPAWCWNSFPATPSINSFASSR